MKLELFADSASIESALEERIFVSVHGVDANEITKEILSNVPLKKIIRMLNPSLVEIEEILIEMKNEL